MKKIIAITLPTVLLFIYALTLINIRQEKIAEAAVQHSPPKIAVFESPKSDKWNDIYFFAKSRNHRVFPKMAEIISDNVVKYSEQYDINPDIVISLMAVESNFNYSTVSDKNAIGLMQVVYKYWKDDPEFKKIVRKENDLFDPELNINAGCYILSVLKKRHKNNRRKFIDAYYGAPGHYERVMNVYGYYKIETEEG